ncbi:MAG: hypothetical protein IJV98_08585 [Clostridia bacterium]|nr:hypothetical protein [Clostridia bacterium]
MTKQKIHRVLMPLAAIALILIGTALLLYALSVNNWSIICLPLLLFAMGLMLLIVVINKANDAPTDGINKEMSARIKLLLILVGVVFSTGSFLYEYTIPYEDPVIGTVILSVDIVLLLLNLFYLSVVLTGNVSRSIINSVLSSLLYLTGLSGVLMALAEGNASLRLLLGILQVLIYAAPSIILLLPVIYFIALIFGG